MDDMVVRKYSDIITIAAGDQVVTVKHDLGVVNVVLGIYGVDVPNENNDLSTLFAVQYVDINTIELLPSMQLPRPIRIRVNVVG
jgi:hypothetical protein